MSTIKTESLAVNLTQAEKLDFGARAARALDAAEQLRIEAKGIAADFKERIAAEEKTVSKLSRCIRTGMEWREVEIHEEIDRSSSRASIYRRDTGELVRTRFLTPEELQKSLDEIWGTDGETGHFVPPAFRDVKPDENGVRRFTDASGTEHEWIPGKFRTLTVGADDKAPDDYDGWANAD